MYIDGVKYVIAPAVSTASPQAEAKGDQEAIAHLQLHKLHFEALLADAERTGTLRRRDAARRPAARPTRRRRPITGNSVRPARARRGGRTSASTCRSCST